MHLGIFAKYWAAGAAKTRLAADSSVGAASRLARAFLKTTLDRLARLDARRQLVFTPESSRRAFERVARGRFEISAQGEGVLGERMRRWFERCFAAGAKRALLLGSDSPDLPLDYVTAAFAELAHKQAVIGPARDGGYYLLGLRGGVLPLFEGIDWGTPTVFEETLDRLRYLGADYTVLPMWYDVDTASDLALLCGNLAASREADPACARLLRVIRRVTGE